MAASPPEAPTLEFEVRGRGERLTLAPRELVVAGFTATDPEAVQRHIAELSSLGVQVPDLTPSFYRLPPALLTAEPSIEVTGERTSGEVEPVLVCDGDDWYLTVGSDHTDREAERTDIELSKAACAKVIAREVVPYADVAAHWDSITLTAWTGSGRTLYQDGLAGDLLSVPALLEVLDARCPVERDSLVLFLGTVPLEVPEFVYSDRYTVAIGFPGDGSAIEVSYEVQPNGQPGREEGGR